MTTFDGRSVAQPNPTQPNPTTVLIIDDHPGTGETHARVLRLGGFHSVTAGTGRVGIELAVARRFDVVLVNLRLPDMSGLDVVRELRARGAGARMVVVAAFPHSIRHSLPAPPGPTATSAGCSSARR